MAKPPSFSRGRKYVLGALALQSVDPRGAAAATYAFVDKRSRRRFTVFLTTFAYKFEAASSAGRPLMVQRDGQKLSLQLGPHLGASLHWDADGFPPFLVLVGEGTSLVNVKLTLREGINPKPPPTLQSARLNPRKMRHMHHATARLQPLPLRPMTSRDRTLVQDHKEMLMAIAAKLKSSPSSSTNRKV